MSIPANSDAPPNNFTRRSETESTCVFCFFLTKPLTLPALSRRVIVDPRKLRRPVMWHRWSAQSSGRQFQGYRWNLDSGYE